MIMSVDDVNIIFILCITFLNGPEETHVFNLQFKGKRQNQRRFLSLSINSLCSAHPRGH